MSTLSEALKQAGIKEEAIPQLEKALEQKIAQKSLENLTLKDAEILGKYLATKEDLTNNLKWTIGMIFTMTAIILSVLIPLILDIHK